MLSSTTGFLAGYYTSVQANQTSEGFLIPVILFGVLLIALLTWFIFLLLRWIFRKVYGNYLAQLRDTMAELDELKD
jgi:fructose-specific phosphotransferase system IIC component